MIELPWQQFAPPGGQGLPVTGPDITITSPTSVISPTHLVHRVFYNGEPGSGLIIRITPPWPDFTGPLYLIGDGDWAFDDSGNSNIAQSVFVDIPINVAVPLVYHREVGLWYIVGQFS